MDDQLELTDALPGLGENLSEPFWRLAEVFRNQVFELCMIEEDDGQVGYYIPYMMNDAVESYLKIEKCHMTGVYKSDETEYTEGELLAEEKGYALIVRQARGNVFTLWFDEIHWTMNLYRYHEIGHFWRKGQEQWRQLVYMAGTLHDKYDYLGDAACNEREKELYRLIEFGPFRRWSPIQDDLEEKYPPTYEGIQCMKRIAEEAGDKRYQFMLRIYQKFPFRRLEQWLSRRLAKPSSEALYRTIYKKIREASLEYPKRRYKIEEQQKIDQQRREADAWLKKKGFRGSYPEYEKDNIWIQAVEQQPFTILEAPDYKFRIYFMISKYRKGQPQRNGGFFKSKDRSAEVKEFPSGIEG